MLYHLWLNWKVGFSQKLTNRETTIILVKMNAVCSLGQFFISLFPLQERILWLPITWTPEFFEALIRGSSICFHCISEKPDVSVLLYFLWYGYGTTNFVIFQVCLAGEWSKRSWDTQQLRKWRRLLLLIAFDIHGIRTLLGPVSDPKRWPAQPITLRLSVTPLLPLWSFHFLHYYVFPALLSGVLSPLEIYLSTFQFLAADACYLWMVLLSLFISYMNAYSVSLHVQSPNLDPQTWLQTA